MLPPTHYRGASSGNFPDVAEYRERIKIAKKKRKHFEENPLAPGADEYFAGRRAFEERVNAAFQPILDELADCQRITAEDLATRVGNSN